ncbi:DUF72 domain-containing protein [Treponema sp.]|uniref:DUF72 domain-containing protein n=1 Tax=Treponema sp. TaxID=166 RepID=UPI0025E12249|nr:DUF72 domain-containing protein [Treponema sp.]MCR5217482.1 DUF72 domain-containing protein [Treponema sp.]
MKEILIGTSGYDYPEWMGVFYPADIKRKDFLSYYAQRFNALEVNNTFYNMPDSKRMISMYDRTEGKIQFSIKANKLLTHQIDYNWQTAADEFISAVMPLKEKGCLASILFQLPQSFHYTENNRFYLAALLKKFSGLPSAVEFRHREWIRESLFEGLNKRNTSIVFCDMPQLKYLPDGKICRTPFTGSTAYIRLHGRNAAAWYACGDSVNGSARYDYDYSQEELKSFIPVINQAVHEDKKVQIYFNNHPKGSGALNALSLKDMLF